MPLQLETQRLLLTPEVDQDAAWLAELFSARGSDLVTPDEALQRISAMTETLRTTGIGALALRVKPHLDPIGYCAIVVGRSSVEEPELAFELLPRAHGCGYATEGARAVLDAAFATGRERIWSTVREWNAPSIRVLEKLGFVRDHSTTDSHGSVLWLVCDQTALRP